MKKVIAVLALASMSLFVACSGNGPEGTAEKFVLHSTKGEFEEAKKYGTESTGRLLSMAEALGGEKIAEMKEKNKDAKVDIISSEVKDTTAVVKYKVTGMEGNDGTERSLNLVKRDNDWKVNMSKENGSGAATE